MARRKKGLPIDGILVLDKPTGMSSNRALQIVKRTLNAQKAGHTGALDPAASGVLPICLGEATKFSQFLLDADKVYLTEASYGQKTDTADADGEIIETRDASALCQADLSAVLPQFIGDIQQIPPMYSALKRNGVPLYKLARQGTEVERKARGVTIHELSMSSFSDGVWPKAEYRVSCSKGTYIRTLMEDVAAAAGHIAHVSMLRRVKAACFDTSKMVTLDELQSICEQHETLDQRLSQLGERFLPTDAGIGYIPVCDVGPEAVQRLRLGQKIPAPNAVCNGLVRVKLGVAFIGLAEIADNYLHPKRMVVGHPQAGSDKATA